MVLTYQQRLHVQTYRLSPRAHRSAALASLRCAQPAMPSMYVWSYEGGEEGSPEGATRTSPQRRRSMTSRSRWRSMREALGACTARRESEACGWGVNLDGQDMVKQQAQRGVSMD